MDYTPEIHPTSKENIEKFNAAFKEVGKDYLSHAGKISELEAELAAIPDKTKGLGKKLSDSIQKKIDDLKWKLIKYNQ